MLGRSRRLAARGAKRLLAVTCAADKPQRSTYEGTIQYTRAMLRQFTVGLTLALLGISAIPQRAEA